MSDILHNRDVPLYHGPQVGDRVVVLHGRWSGRVGTLTGFHFNPGGMVQQSQSYPVVALDACGRAKERTVRVVAVSPAPMSS